MYMYKPSYEKGDKGNVGDSDGVCRGRKGALLQRLNPSDEITKEAEE